MSRRDVALHRGLRGSSACAMHLTAGLVLAGSVGKGDIDSAACEHVLALVSM